MDNDHQFSGERQQQYDLINQKFAQPQLLNFNKFAIAESTPEKDHSYGNPDPKTGDFAKFTKPPKIAQQVELSSAVPEMRSRLFTQEEKMDNKNSLRKTQNQIEVPRQTIGKMLNIEQLDVGSSSSSSQTSLNGVNSMVRKVGSQRTILITSRPSSAKPSSIDHQKAQLFKMFKIQDSEQSSAIGDPGKMQPESETSSVLSQSLQSSQDIDETSSLSSEESMAEDDKNNEVKVLRRMENYYNQNYSCNNIFKIKDIFHQIVLNVHFDETFDLIYVILLKIKMKEGRPLYAFSNVERRPSEDLQSVGSSPTNRKPGPSKFLSPDKKVFSFPNTPKGGSKNTSFREKYTAKALNIEQQAIQFYEQCNFEVDMCLGIWNVDERILKMHQQTKVESGSKGQFSKKKIVKDLDSEFLNTDNNRHQSEPNKDLVDPIQNRSFFKTDFRIDSPMSRFEQLKQIRNEFQDFSQILQTGSKIYIQVGFSSVLAYDSATNEFLEHPFTVIRPDSIDLHPKSFKSALQFKDQSKKNQFIEHILIFTYYQQETTEAVPLRRGTSNSVRRVGTPPPLGYPSGDQQQFMMRNTQQISLKKVPFASQLDNPLRKGMFKVKENFINFEDAQLFEYYENHNRRNFASIFVQRISFSHTYIVLFPTGLLMLVCFQPFSIQAKINLNLKKDETIIDISYRLQTNYEHHCLWLIDEKMQIWRCVNELNPNSVNWTLTKITMLDNQFPKQFLQPAMTFDDYFEASSMFSLEGFKQYGPDFKRQSRFLLAYNSTSTKTIIISYPRIEEKGQYLAIPEVEERNNKNLDLQLRERFNITSEQLGKASINLMVLSKNQSVILSKIKDAQFRKTREERNKPMPATKQSYKLLRQISNLRKSVISSKCLNIDYSMKLQAHDSQHGSSKSLQASPNNKGEIISHECLGKIRYSEGNVLPVTSTTQDSEVFWQFIVQKPKSMEYLFTNGITQIHETIMLSESTQLSVVSYKLSDDNTKKTVLYSPEGLPSLLYFKPYRVYNGKFQLDQDSILPQKLPAATHKIIDEHGFQYTITLGVIEQQYSLSRMRTQGIEILQEGCHLNLILPEGLFPFGLQGEDNPLSRIQQSRDGRILFSDQLMLKFNRDWTKLVDIGCILVEKDAVSLQYKFNSLFDKRDRNQIERALKVKNDQAIVTFDEQPVFPKTYPNQFYVAHTHDYLTNESSVVKVYSDSLQCFEVYTCSSRPKISIFEKKPLQSNTTDFLPVLTKNQLWNTNPGLASDSSKKRASMARNSSAHASQRPSSQSEMNGTAIANERANLLGLSYQGLSSGPGASQVYLSLLMTRSNQTAIEIIVDHRCNTHRPQSPSFSAFLKRGSSAMDNKHDCESNEPSEEVELMTYSPYSPGQESNARSISFRGMKSKLSMVSSSFLTKRDSNPDPSQVEPYRCDFHSLVIVCFKCYKITKKDSCLSWVTKNQLLLSIKNDTFLINLKRHVQYVSVKNSIFYAIQQVNVSLFCFIIRGGHDLAKDTQSSKMPRKSIDGQTITKRVTRTNKGIDEARDCIMRMEIASIRKCVQIQNSIKTNKSIRRQIVFTPSEELHGANIFSKLSNNFQIIRPLLEQVDGHFIEHMNNTVQNISTFVDKQYYFRHFQKFKMETNQTAERRMDEKQEQTGVVHMYQQDMVGKNPIDYAFEKNAIYCIKAFVETLLILPNDDQFRNCFDKAILLMIQKGMDVKDLVNSQLFYPRIWQEYQVYCPTDSIKMIPFNGDLMDLKYENPNLVFEETNTEENEQLRTKMATYRQKMSLKKLQKLNMRWTKSKEDEDSHSEHFQMQFNYIYMDEIQGDDKVQVSQTLKDCQDIELFEQDAIQHIIDFKWERYARDFFFFKFMLYIIFVAFYYIDLESIHHPSEDGKRNKNFLFFLCKAVCFLVQALFILYELVQMKVDGRNYLFDPWNYFELMGSFLYILGAIWDINESEVDDKMMILFSITTLFGLIKVVYLIRVFRQLNFLVTMFITVCREIYYFMILFTIFLFTFAITFHVVEVDIDSYGRVPALVSHFVSVFRCALGDFSMINIWQGFDIQEGTDENGNIIYRHSQQIVLFTFVIFLLCAFLMFIIFMNFLIAVISEAYNKIIQNKEAFDYQQRAMMIYEREVYFTKDQLNNQEYFPSVIIVRKKKQTQKKYKKNWQGYLQIIKNFVSQQGTKQLEHISQKSNEQQMSFMSSIKIIENDLHNVNKDLDKLSNIFFSNMSKRDAHHWPQRHPTEDLAHYLQQTSTQQTQQTPVQPMVPLFGANQQSQFKRDYRIEVAEVASGIGDSSSITQPMGGSSSSMQPNRLIAHRTDEAHEEKFKVPVSNEKPTTSRQLPFTPAAPNQPSPPTKNPHTPEESDTPLASPHGADLSHITAGNNSFENIRKNWNDSPPFIGDSPQGNEEMTFGNHPLLQNLLKVTLREELNDLSQNFKAQLQEIKDENQDMKQLLKQVLTMQASNLEMTTKNTSLNLRMTHEVHKLTHKELFKSGRGGPYTGEMPQKRGRGISESSSRFNVHQELSKIKQHYKESLNEVSNHQPDIVSLRLSSEGQIHSPGSHHRKTPTSQGSAIVIQPALPRSNDLREFDPPTSSSPQVRSQQQEKRPRHFHNNRRSSPDGMRLPLGSLDKRSRSRGSNQRAAKGEAGVKESAEKTRFPPLNMDRPHTLNSPLQKKIHTPKNPNLRSPKNSLPFHKIGEVNHQNVLDRAKQLLEKSVRYEDKYGRWAERIARNMSHLVTPKTSNIDLGGDLVDMKQFKNLEQALKKVGPTDLPRGMQPTHVYKPKKSAGKDRNLDMTIGTAQGSSNIVQMMAAGPEGVKFDKLARLEELPTPGVSGSYSMNQVGYSAKDVYRGQFSSSQVIPLMRKGQNQDIIPEMKAAEFPIFSNREYRSPEVEYQMANKVRKMNMDLLSGRHQYFSPQHSTMRKKTAGSRQKPKGGQMKKEVKPNEDITGWTSNDHIS